MAAGIARVGPGSSTDETDLRTTPTRDVIAGLRLVDPAVTGIALLVEPTLILRDRLDEGEDKCIEVVCFANVLVVGCDQLSTQTTCNRAAVWAYNRGIPSRNLVIDEPRVTLSCAALFAGTVDPKSGRNVVLISLS